MSRNLTPQQRHVRLLSLRDIQFINDMFLLGFLEQLDLIIAHLLTASRGATAPPDILPYFTERMKKDKKESGDFVAPQPFRT